MNCLANVLLVMMNVGLSLKDYWSSPLARITIYVRIQLIQPWLINILFWPIKMVNWILLSFNPIRVIWELRFLVPNPGTGYTRFESTTNMDGYTSRFHCGWKVGTDRYDEINQTRRSDIYLESDPVGQFELLDSILRLVILI